MLLARLPAAFHQAAGQCGVLAEEDRGEPSPRPPRHPHPPRPRLEGRLDLGARTEALERAPAAEEVGTAHAPSAHKSPPIGADADWPTLLWISGFRIRVRGRAG